MNACWVGSHDVCHQALFVLLLPHTSAAAAAAAAVAKANAEGAVPKYLPPFRTCTGFPIFRCLVASNITCSMVNTSFKTPSK